MPSNQLIALVLVAVALLDLIIGVVVVRPRLQKEMATIVTAAFAASSLVMIVLAAVFWFGVFSN